jgi:hypothetical protein
MNARRIVINGIFVQDPAQVRFPEYDHVVETFPPLRLSDHSPLFQRGPAVWAGLGALALDDALRTQQTAADRVRAVGVDGVPDDGAAEAVRIFCFRPGFISCSPFFFYSCLCKN